MLRFAKLAIAGMNQRRQSFPHLPSRLSNTVSAEVTTGQRPAITRSWPSLGVWKIMNTAKKSGRVIFQGRAGRPSDATIIKAA